MAIIPTDAHRALKLDSPLGEDLICVSLKGHEELGRLFEYRLELRSLNYNIKFEDIVGQRVTLRLALREGERYFDGFVSQFRYAESAGKFAAYRAVIKPWFWFLTRTADCRIFQNQKVPDIIKAVFRDNGMSDFDDRLSETYREWEYCVQYRESDFNFLSRLMEQEGIYYFFEHLKGKHVLVLADSHGAHEPFPGYEKIPYFPPDTSLALRKRDYIHYWEVCQTIMPGKYAIKDFDFLKPKVDLTAKLTRNRPHAFPLPDHEIYDYPGEYTEIDDGSNSVEKKLQELQAQHERALATGTARGMCVGSLFTLEHYPREDQNKKYLVISTRHDVSNDILETGEQSGSGENYVCHAEVLDSTEPFRSERISPKPVVQGPQSAIVVGPADQEIHCDEHGRVIVQFHWDRYGQNDENSSCWVRVSQLWAGKNWGGIHIPRIGQEVLVSFLEGDPDQPVITGRVYNAENKPPYELPANKTQSGIKSRSSMQGTSNHFNEFRFEDEKDKEEIYLHAEKNLKTVVENTENRTTYNNRKAVVGSSDNARPTDAIEELVVHGMRLITIHGNDGLVVLDGDKGRKVQVRDGDYELEIQKGDHLINVDMGDSITEVKAGDITVNAAAGMIKMTAAKSIEFSVGSNSVLIDTKGVTIKGALINSEATGIQTIKGSMVKINS